jgi:hypothetical protein
MKIGRTVGEERIGWSLELSLCGRDADANNAVKAEMGIRLGTQAPFFLFCFCLHYEDLPSKKAKTMDQLRSSCHLHVPSIREVARMIQAAVLGRSAFFSCCLVWARAK